MSSTRRQRSAGRESGRKGSRESGRDRGRGRGRGPATVADVLAAVAELAPLELAAEWDNVGLIAGRAAAPARRVLVALDLTDAVAAEALRTRADVVLLYHPPIFKGIRRITPDADGPTRKLPELLGASVALLAVHTALDAAAGGTNDLLLDAFDLAAREPLEPAPAADAPYKLVVFVPPAEATRLRAALATAGAGRIGHYDECSFELDGRGTFRGDETTHPTIGEPGVLERANETRLEMIVPRRRLAGVVRALYATHSYEEPAFDVYPLHALAGRADVGMGRVGHLRRAESGAALLRQLAAVVDLNRAQVVGRLRRRFRRVIAAAGAFGVRSFRDPEALVLTGEFKHHDALELLRRDVTAVHLGHYASERPVLALLRDQVARRLPGVRVSVSRADGPPLRPLTESDTQG